MNDEMINEIIIIGCKVIKTTCLPYKNLAGQGVHTPPFKSLTVLAKNWSPIVAFKAHEFSHG